MGSPKHLALIRTLPCAKCGKPGPSQAHHSTAHRRGLSTKADDLDTFPLCAWCHKAFHDSRGSFRSWDKAARRLWQQTLVSLYRPAQEDGKDNGDQGEESPGEDPWGEIF